MKFLILSLVSVFFFEKLAFGDCGLKVAKKEMALFLAMPGKVSDRGEILTLAPGERPRRVFKYLTEFWIPKTKRFVKELNEALKIEAGMGLNENEYPYVYFFGTDEEISMVVDLASSEKYNAAGAPSNAKNTEDAVHRAGVDRGVELYEVLHKPYRRFENGGEFLVGKLLEPGIDTLKNDPKEENKNTVIFYSDPFTSIKELSIKLTENEESNPDISRLNKLRLIRAFLVENFPNYKLDQLGASLNKERDGILTIYSSTTEIGEEAKTALQKEFEWLSEKRIF